MHPQLRLCWSIVRSCNRERPVLIVVLCLHCSSAYQFRTINRLNAVQRAIAIRTSGLNPLAPAPQPSPASYVNVMQPVHLWVVQILGQARDPAVIQAHLKKLFAGVHSVALTDKKDAITAAVSVESEQVQLATAVPVSEQVEGWLQNLLTGMQATLQV